MKKLLTSLAVLSLIGCATIEVNRIESKAKGIAFGISAKMLKDKPALREDFIQASSDLKFLASQEVADVNTMIVIITRLPKLQEGDWTIIIQAGLIMFSDELSTLAVKNPLEIRLAAKGFYEGIDMALGFVAPKALKSPLLRDAK